MPKHTITNLLEVMARLRNPEGGCPWDVEQDFATIAPYTIEEAYEVDQAIREGDMAALADELGDLLFQVVFHAQMAAEAGHFTFADVVAAVTEKMIRRHPHVFGEAEVEDADAQTGAWEVAKEKERIARAEARGEAPSVLDGVAHGYPALMRAVKLQRRAARVGFDWPSKGPVLDKVEEEWAELRAELNTPDGEQRVAEEFGDFLFVVSNLARHLKVDPEQALREANAKFERRFRRIEALLAEDGRGPADSSLEEMDALWDRAKAEQV